MLNRWREKPRQTFWQLMKRPYQFAALPLAAGVVFLVAFCVEALRGQLTWVGWLQLLVPVAVATWVVLWFNRPTVAETPQGTQDEVPPSR